MKKSKPNKEYVALQNDLKRVCQLYVMEYHPGVYRALQSAVGITPKTMDPRLSTILERALSGMKDKCEVCKGARGGVPGNENIVGGVRMCDYCHADAIDNREKLKQQGE